MSDMLEPLIYAAVMHNGKPKTVAEFERAAANVADMLRRRATAGAEQAMDAWIKRTRICWGDYDDEVRDRSTWLKVWTAAWADGASAEWQPIETAPENMDAIAVVGWVDSDGQEHHDLDHKEDGCWQRWHDHAEHVEMIGGHGVSYTAPYTHWVRLSGIPHSRPPVHHTGESNG